MFNMDSKAGGMGVGAAEIIALIEAALPIAKSVFGVGAPDASQGGVTTGSPESLQPLNAHGGEFVMNENATDEYAPELEAMNASVPPDPTMLPEEPVSGPSYFGGGGTADSADPGPAAGEDPGIGTDTPGDIGPALTGPGTPNDSLFGGGPAGGASTTGTGASNSASNPGNPGTANSTGASTVSAEDSTVGANAAAAGHTAGINPDTGLLSIGPPSMFAARAPGDAFSLANAEPGGFRAGESVPYGLHTNTGAFRAGMDAINPFSGKPATGIGRTASLLGTMAAAGTGLPAGAALGFGVGAADNANMNHAMSMFGVSDPGAVTPAMLSFASADIGNQVSGIQSTAGSTGANAGGDSTEFEMSPSLPESGRFGVGMNRAALSAPPPGTNQNAAFGQKYKGKGGKGGYGGIKSGRTRRGGGFGIQA